MNPDYEAFFAWWDEEKLKMCILHDECVEDYALRIAMFSWLSGMQYLRQNQNSLPSPQ
jgi:hypothetical protein